MKAQWRNAWRNYHTYILLERHLSKSSIEAYASDIEAFADFVQRTYNVPPAEVTREMVEAYLADLYDRGQASSSQSRHLSGVKGLFNHMVLTRLIATSPCEFITSPKQQRHLPSVLSIEQIDALLNSIDTSTPKGLRDCAIIELLYSCGLRVSEAITLRMSDIYFAEGVLRVMGKGSKERLVPLSEVAQKRIEEYLQVRDSKGYNEEVLFLNNRGRALTRVMLFTMIRQYAAACGIVQKISPHTFRHSFATHLLEGGASIREVQQMLGHENITTTEIYTHLESSHLQDVVERCLPIK